MGSTGNGEGRDILGVTLEQLVADDNRGIRVAGSQMC